jgi:spore coat protein U-like protein
MSRLGLTCRFWSAWIALGIALLPASPVLGVSKNSNITVTLTVSPNCTIRTDPLSFGIYDPVITNATVAKNATATVTIACTKGAGPAISLDLGQHPSGSNRFMASTSAGVTDALQYQVYQPPNTTPGTVCAFPATKIWGATTAETFAPSKPNNREAKSYNVCGTIPAGQNVNMGAYADTIVATINF